VALTEKLLDKFQEEPDRTQRRKMARQAARSVLPNATETKIFVTGNARALRHFIEMRGSRHAEVEIRKLAVKVLQIMQQEAPHIFGDYELIPLPDGTLEAGTSHRKV
jgi:thymidylate synthase (FAD)